MTGARAATRRSRCKECGEFSEEVGLRYAGINRGYVSLCESCAGKINKVGFLTSKEGSE